MLKLGFHDEVRSQIGSLPTQLQFGSFSSANIQVGSLPTGLSLGQLTGNGGGNFDLNSLPASLAAYRSERNSLSWDDGSAYESDRPLSVSIFIIYRIIFFAHNVISNLI